MARLAEAIDQSPAELRTTLEQAGRELSVRVAVVSRKAGDRIAAMGIDGVVVVPSPRRTYPNGPLGPLLGYVGVGTPTEAGRWPDLRLGEYAGRDGLERQYDSLLRGVDGRQCVLVDPPGEPRMMAHRREPVPGANLRLSIDLGLQQKLTERLGSALRASGGDLGGAVIMDPRTGQVLAMASLPAYDNTIFGPPVDAPAVRRAEAAAGHSMLEHVTQVTAPPGSAFKIVVAAANMVYPAIDPDAVIPTGGSFTYGGHTFGNWRSFGPQNLEEAIAWSNNVYFYQLALAVGPNGIADVGTALGVGRRTGIDLPGEQSGFLGTPDNVGDIGATWYGGSTVILGIGQGYVTVTPLQVARWTAGIAAGSLPTPRLGIAYGTGDGTYRTLRALAPKRVPFAGKLGPVREGMQAAATYGTAARLSVLPVQAGGKTGSAEDPNSPNGRPNSWYTAAAPLDDPAVVMTSFVRGGGSGAGTSGPVVAETLQYFFANEQQILDTPATRPADAGDR
jgi:cell division protein FtsI/penicillin-binding protein 2